MTKEVFRQIMAIRDSGETNMYDLYAVQYLAFHRGYYELALYLEDHLEEYAHFIMTGEAPAEDGSGMRRFDENDSDEDDSDEDESDKDGSEDDSDGDC